MDTVAGLRTDPHEWGEVHYYEHDLPTCAQKISENDVDAAHFQYLHGMPAMNEAEATTVWAKTRSRLRLFRDSEVPKCLRVPNWTVRSLPAIERLGPDF